MYQKLIIAGNLGADPVMKYTPDGKAVTSFRVACSNHYKDKTETTWYQCVAWGKQAEFVSEYFHKGNGVIVEGRLTPDKETGGPRLFQRKDQTWGASYEVDVTTVEFPPKSGKDEASEEIPY